MTTRHPFTWIDIQVQKVAFWPLLVFALLLMAVQQVLGKPLITPAAPSGIVSFELAGSLPNAREMLESWGPTGRVYAASVWAQTICSLSPILSPFLSDAFWLHVASCSDQAIYLALGLSSPGLSSARRLAVRHWPNLLELLWPCLDANASSHPTGTLGAHLV